MGDVWCAPSGPHLHRVGAEVQGTAEPAYTGLQGAHGQHQPRLPHTLSLAAPQASQPLATSPCTPTFLPLSACSCPSPSCPSKLPLPLPSSLPLLPLSFVPFQTSPAVCHPSSLPLLPLTFLPFPTHSALPLQTALTPHLPALSGCFMASMILSSTLSVSFAATPAPRLTYTCRSSTDSSSSAPGTMVPTSGGEQCEGCGNVPSNQM